MQEVTGAGRALPRVNLVTPDRADASVIDATRVALGAADAFVQVRTKGGADRDRLAFAAEVVAACHALGALCLVNDRVDLALAAGADGVHLGDDDLPVAVARDLMGPDASSGPRVARPKQPREPRLTAPPTSASDRPTSPPRRWGCPSRWVRQGLGPWPPLWTSR